MVGKRGIAGSVIEYGVQTTGSKTVLTVTQDEAEAEQMLDLLGEGWLVQRTVYYSPWVTVPIETRP
jgi:hypothetical protein